MLFDSMFLLQAQTFRKAVAFVMERCPSPTLPLDRLKDFAENLTANKLYALRRREELISFPFQQSEALPIAEGLP
jgi:hypothetical protein